MSNPVNAYFHIRYNGSMAASDNLTLVPSELIWHSPTAVDVKIVEDLKAPWFGDLQIVMGRISVVPSDNEAWLYAVSPRGRSVSTPLGNASTLTAWYNMEDKTFTMIFSFEAVPVKEVEAVQ